jgi:integrase/recombinase XerD
MAPEKLRSKTRSNHFRLYLKSQGYSEHSIKTYLFHIEKLSEKYIIDQFTYKETVLAISDPTYSLRYRQVIVAALKQYFHFLMWCGKRDSHPCPNLRIRSNYSKNFLKQDFLSADELQLLRTRKQRYQLLDLRDQVLLSLMTIQGLSPAELVHLDVQHIKFGSEKLFVPASRKNKQRTLSLLPQQIELFAAYINEVRPAITKSNTKAFLLAKTGERLSADCIHYLISTLKDIVPEKTVTPSTIRQSVICWWINDLKIPLEQVQLMSGHRWISATQRYEFRKTEDDLALVNKWQ